MKTAIQSFIRRQGPSILVLLLMVAPALTAKAAMHAARQFANGGRVLAHDPRETEAREMKLIAYYYGHTFMLTADHLYQNPGAQDDSDADRRFGYSLVPVWQTEPASVVRMLQTTGKTWQVWLRTESGVEGYLELRDLNQLTLFLQPLQCL